MQDTSNEDILHEPAIIAEAYVPARSVITLRITAGRVGQSARTHLFLAERPLSEETDSFAKSLGNANDLGGKRLHTTTTVTDHAHVHNDAYFKIEILANGEVVFYEQRARTLPRNGNAMRVSAYVELVVQ